MTANKFFFLASALFILVTVFIFFPFILGGQIMNDEFVIHHQLPILAFLSNHFKSHSDSPLWAEGYMNGYPFYVGGYSYLPPMVFFFKFFDYPPAYGMLLLLFFSAAAVLTYVLARNLSLSNGAAMVAALVYAFSQFNIRWSLLLPFALSVALVPLIFLSVLKIFNGSKKYLIICSLALAWNWYNGFSEFALYTNIFALLFAFYLDLVKNGYSLKIWRFKTSLYMILASFLGAFLAIPRLVNTFSFLEYSVRSKGTAGETIFFGSGDIVSHLYPHFKVEIVADLINYFKTGAFDLYIGPLALLFLLTSIFFFKSDLLKRKALLFFTAVSAIAFLTLFRYSFLFYSFRAVTGGIFGGAWKLVFLGNFGLALLVGFGFDNAARLKEIKNFRKILLFFSIVFLIFLAGLVIIGSLDNQLLNKMEEAAKTDKIFKSNVELRNFAFLLSIAKFVSWNSYNFLVATFIVLASLGVFWLFLSRRLNYLLFRKVCLIIFIMTPVLMWYKYHPAISKEFLTQTPETVKFMKKYSGEPFRVFRFWPGLGIYQNYLNKNGVSKQLTPEIIMALKKETLAPNLNLIYNIDAFEGDENFMSYRQSKMAAHVGSVFAPQNEGDKWMGHTSIPLKEKVDRFQSPANRALLSMMNIAFVTSSVKLDLPFKPVFETIVDDTIPVAVFLNPEAITRIYLPENVKFTGPDRDTAFQELLKIKDFRKTALVECQKETCPSLNGKIGKHDEIQIAEFQPGYLKAKVKTEFPRWLVFSESNLPTWEAILATSNKRQETSGGKAENSTNLKIYSANYLYQGIYLPAGENEVIFEYPGLWQQTKYSLDRLKKKLLY